MTLFVTKLAREKTASLLDSCNPLPIAGQNSFFFSLGTAFGNTIDTEIRLRILPESLRDRVDEQKACHCDFSSRRGQTRKAPVRGRFWEYSGVAWKSGAVPPSGRLPLRALPLYVLQLGVLGSFSVTGPTT